MGLHQSNGAAAVYKFIWSVVEPYGPFLLSRLVASWHCKAAVSAHSLAKWNEALFSPKEDKLANEYSPSRLGPWLLDALRLHGQEMGRRFELVECPRIVNSTEVRECAVVYDTMALATAQATTESQARMTAVSKALTQLDFFGPHAVDALYAYSDATETELEFSVGKRDGVFNACVHWGNGRESHVIGRAVRASSVEVQNAAAVLAARFLDLSLPEFMRSGNAVS